LLEKFPVARRFLAGFTDTSLPRDVQELLGRGLAGVVLYPRNFKSPAGLAALCAEIRAAARGPVFIGIDQEGGTQFSLPAPFTQWPAPEEFGALGDGEAVRAAARAIGLELAACGCNLNFAPMLDLHVNPASPITQRRSYGADPELVGRMGSAFHAGLAECGVLSCAKHFPGHGDAELDPHDELPVFHGTHQRLEQVELVPFAAAIAAGVPAIMTAHILLPRIHHALPATLSRDLLTGILRLKLGFRGLIVADDLGMGAIRRHRAPGEAAVAAFAAGADLAMICHDWPQVEAAIEQVTLAVDAGKLAFVEWESAGRRIERALLRAEKTARQPFAVIGCRAHRELAAQLHARVEVYGGATSANAATESGFLRRAAPS
jgi:beta-N-acetylhexosaminidase